MNVTIARAAADDAEILTEIQKKAFVRLYEMYRDEQNPYLRGSGELREQIESGERDVYKIFYGGALCGGLTVRDRGGGEYYLNRVCVLPELQGKNIGRRAIALAEKNYAAARWAVDFPADLPMNRRCYEACGYSDTGAREKISDALTLAYYEKNIDGIFPVRESRFEEAAALIRESFATVARDFGLTRANCPNHTSFTTAEILRARLKSGWMTFGLYKEGKIIGYVSLSDEGGGVFEMHNLAVPPANRHAGYGKRLADFCEKKALGSGARILKIHIVEDNTVLKSWYLTNGHAHTGTTSVPHLPFTVGCMEKALV